MKRSKIRLRMIFPPALLWVFLFTQFSWALSDEEIRNDQAFLSNRTAGERMAFWAEKFLRVPYDRDPQGLYVTRAAIVADDAVDCMYLTFRSVELALSRTPEEAIQVAIDKRFHTKGILQDGKVVNYEDRFQYGEDMIWSGKWGREITSQIGRTDRIRGSRSYDFFEVLPPMKWPVSKESCGAGISFSFLRLRKNGWWKKGLGTSGS